MVIKGGARGGPAALSKHLLRTDTNERVSVRELYGVTAKTLQAALKEMDGMAAAARSTRTLYHANIDTRVGEELTEAQKLLAVERLAANLGMTDQPRAVVEHVKHGREHLHVVFMRIDLARMAAIPDSHNYRKHEEVSRDLEREFGHERVQGAHVGRDGQKRPIRTPTHSEMQQAGRSGLSPQEAKVRVTELWNHADTGKSFTAALENDGWILARGDKRDFVIIDPAGETHSLAKRIEGAKAAQVRNRMADVDVTRLPSVDEAKAMQRDRTLDRNQAQHVEPPAETINPALKPENVVLKIQPPPSYVPTHRPLELIHDPSRHAQAPHQKSVGMDVAGHPSEATQKPSVELEKPPAPPKRSETEHRPAPAMFRQLYTAAAEMTYRVLNKARRLIDRQTSSETVPEAPRQPTVSMNPERVDDSIRVLVPPRQIDSKRPDKTPRKTTVSEIIRQVEAERKTAVRTPADQLRAELARERDHHRDGPEL